MIITKTVDKLHHTDYPFLAADRHTQYIPSGIAGLLIYISASGTNVELLNWSLLSTVVWKVSRTSKMLSCDLLCMTLRVWIWILNRAQRVLDSYLCNPEYNIYSTLIMDLFTIQMAYVFINLFLVVVIFFKLLTCWNIVSTVLFDPGIGYIDLHEVSHNLFNIIPHVKTKEK